MTLPTELTPTLAVKLASLTVHAREACSPTGRSVDVEAAGALADDPEVAAWLAEFDPVLLPERR